MYLIIMMMRCLPGGARQPCNRVHDKNSASKTRKNWVMGVRREVNKDILTYITATLIVFALTCTVSANSDDESILQDETDVIAAIQEAIETNGGCWTAGPTSVSNYSVDWKKALCGAKVGPLPFGAVVVQQPAGNGVSSGAFDWRDKDGENWVTPVRSQGSCGSCWAFSAIGAVESAVLIYTNNPDMNIDLSEQHLVSDCCSAGSCSGGWPDWALDYVRDTGVPDESCFPYTASSSSCDPCSGWTERVWNIKDHVYVKSTTDDFKWALQEYGPISVVLTVPDDWYYYTGGVYTPVWSSDDGVGWANHAVLLVGWNDYDGCWIVKNSWGTGWGESGYARVKYGDLETYNYAYAVTGVVTGNKPPEASASATPLNGDAPLEVAFAGSGTDSDGTIASYHWGFGDGNSSESQSPSHRYTIPETYTATLTVTDNEGAIGTDIVVIEVTIGSMNQPPTASASATPASGEVPLEVAFAGSGNDSDGTIVSYHWDFGDEKSSKS
ncbi:MAG TPA: PKD domain-containing protein, partial [Methanosarcinales archaeon]|nr:PKD domain-containing protein [Methanosarcinales archaeon]